MARYIGRYGTKWVKKAVLIAAVPPLMLKTPANPEGLPLEVFDGIRAGVLKDRSQYYKDLAIAFYGKPAPHATERPELRSTRSSSRTLLDNRRRRYSRSFATFRPERGNPR